MMAYQPGERLPTVDLPYPHLGVIPDGPKGLVYVDFGDLTPPTPNEDRFTVNVLNREPPEYVFESLFETGLVIGHEMHTLVKDSLYSNIPATPPPDMHQIERLSGALGRYNYALMIINQASSLYVSEYTEPNPYSDLPYDTKFNRTKYNELRMRTRDVDNEPPMRFLLGLTGRSGLVAAHLAVAPRILRIIYDQA